MAAKSQRQPAPAKPTLTRARGQSAPRKIERPSVRHVAVLGYN